MFFNRYFLSRFRKNQSKFLMEHTWPAYSLLVMLCGQLFIVNMVNSTPQPPPIRLEFVV